MGKYCKLPPSAVKKININGTPLSKKAPKHPDGWFLCLPAHCSSLWNRDKYETFEEAIYAAGGIILDEEQAFESQRGNLTGRGDDSKSSQSSSSSGDTQSSSQGNRNDSEEGEGGAGI